MYLVDCVGRFTDKGGIPLPVGGDCTQLFEGDASRVGMAWVREVVLEANVDVLDRNLQIVHDFGGQLTEEAITTAIGLLVCRLLLLFTRSLENFCVGQAALL